jgi:hypothetical protein
MITEQICIDVVRTLYHRTSTRTGSQSPMEHTLPSNDVYRELLPQYSLLDVDITIHWLGIGNYIGYVGFGIERVGIFRTAKGIRLAETGRLEDDDRRLIYQEDPYAAFVARQFQDDDLPLFAYLQESVLRPIGIKAIDGRMDGIEAFRGEILRKIRTARFFICILTHRKQLVEGGFASSVWLYQETGAAVALGKKPLVLVENGMDEHYAGELQKNYQCILFSRESYEPAFDEAGQRVKHNLMENHIPLRSKEST